MHITKLGKPVTVNKSTRKLWFCDSICFAETWPKMITYVEESNESLNGNSFNLYTWFIYTKLYIKYGVNRVG